MILVTAADTSHARSLLQLIRTFRAYHQEDRVSVWDLGMTAEDRRQLDEQGLHDCVTVFPYAEYPEYYDVRNHAGQYAWKPAIVAREYADADDVLVWADAGCRIDGPLDRLVQYARANGVYASLTCGSVEKWTDNRCIEWIGESPEMCKCYQMRAATLLAFSQAPEVQDLVRRWAECAAVRDCIAPEGATKQTHHRQDQSVLNVLLLKLGLYGRLPVEQCRWNWTAHCDCDGRPRNV